VPFVQTAAGYSFWVILAALVPFWAVQGTEPTGHLALVFLYGALAASAVIWLTARLLVRRRKISESPKGNHIVQSFSGDVRDSKITGKEEHHER
jgi:hypothetical protein